MPPKDAWSVVVTTLALLVYGVLQERVMTRTWGVGKAAELFPYSAFLVLCNRLTTVAALLAHSSLAGGSFVPAAPVKSYCLVSASNMVSTLCQYEALKYVSFVTQTLAKTAKALPVLLWGTVVGRRRYKATQYIHAVLITGGCSLFVLGGDITSSAAAGHAPGGSSWWGHALGMALLLVYLAADGWTSTQQEHLFRAHATSIREQLLFTTAFSSVYSLVATLAGGQLVPAVAFLGRHPPAAGAVLLLSVMSTIIQVCISHVLQQHGALVFALMMTTRQCASVLLSSLLFGHSLTISQWIGVAVVFSALYHQKAKKTGSSSRRSTTGRLPHMRDSHHGTATPLLAKQITAPAATIHRHAVSAAGLQAAAAAGGGSKGGSGGSLGGSLHGSGSSGHLSSAAGAAAGGAAGRDAGRGRDGSGAGVQVTSSYLGALQQSAAVLGATGMATPRHAIAASRAAPGQQAAAGATAVAGGSSPLAVQPNAAQPAALLHHSSLPVLPLKQPWHQGSGTPAGAAAGAVPVAPAAPAAHRET